MDKVLECKVIKIENEKILKDFKEVIVREYPLTIILSTPDLNASFIVLPALPTN